LRRLNQAHRMAILFISHDLASVAALCTRVGVLNCGRLVKCGPADALLTAGQTMSADLNQSRTA